MSNVIQIQFHQNEPFLNQTVPETILSEPKKRWQFALAKIYCCRAFLLKPSPEIINAFGSTLSDSVVHVGPDDQVDGFFNIDQSRLSELVKDKKLDKLEELGGVEGIASALRTDTKKGIQGDDEDLASRREAFGDNTCKKVTTKGFFHFVWEACKDVTIYLMLLWALFSLAYGIAKHGWEDGLSHGSISVVSVFLGIAVSAVGNFIQNRQLSKEINNIEIEVVRSGRPHQISIYDIVVGEVVSLKVGDHVPADGLFLDGHSLQIDESNLTGESDHVEVSPKNPFLFYGTKVYYGYAHMLVTSVGTNTTWDETMSSIIGDNDDETPLQTRLDTLTEATRKISLAIALLVLVSLLVLYSKGYTVDENILDAINHSIIVAMIATAVAIPQGLPLDVTLITIRFFTGKTTDENNVWKFKGSKNKNDGLTNAMINLHVAILAIVGVIVPEGVPLALIVTLAYLIEKMMPNQATVRKLSACQTMRSATTICTDKTGTLTMNQMKVTKFWVGEEAMEQSSISLFVLELLQEGVAFNTTGSVCNSISGSGLVFSGSPTERAILSWAVLGLGMDVEELKQRFQVVDVEAFNSHEKRSGVLIRRNDDKTSHIHWKGAAEMVLAMCSSYYETSGKVKDLDGGQRDVFQQIIQSMAASSLRCIAFAHSQVSQNQEDQEAVSEEKKIKDKNLTFLGLVGLKDPCRPGVKKAVQDCQQAGVNIKLITGDNVFTARAIATECGILKPDQDMSGAVIEGAEFRSYTEAERMEKVDKIRVMARSSPLDKLLMVRCLKHKGHVVAATGDGTNNAHALKEADIGLSMGIQATQVTKQSSDILILEGNFCSVAVVLKWGRCVYDNIQKLIQMQLTLNVAALTINFVATTFAYNIPFNGVQLLWVNIIMDTLGALALASEQPTKEIMEKPPVEQTEPLVTNIMWRNLLAQAFYQISILLTILFWGHSILNVKVRMKHALIFNTFVLCQVFNEFVLCQVFSEFNAAEMKMKSVFEWIHKKRMFLGIIGVTIVLQVVMVEFLYMFADTERLTFGEWWTCFGMAALSWPIGWMVKWIPVPGTPILDYMKPFKYMILGWINYP